MPTSTRARQQRLFEQLSSTKADALLITHLPNIRYLTGFTGSSAALACAGNKLAFFTDGRYTTQARAEVEGARILIPKKKSALTAAVEWLAAQKPAAIALDADHLTLAQSNQIKSTLKKLSSKAKLLPSPDLVARLRMTKDSGEIARIRAANSLASAQFEPLLPHLKPGTPETAVAAQLEFACRIAGAEGMSFETIVAAGKRSALPHGVASPAPLPKRGFVVLDYGVILAGYCSDMTRTVFIGRPSTREREIYNAVLEAHEAAKAAVAPGVPCEHVDAAARKVLARAKLAQYFTHSTGHGVGLEIHEPPRIGKKQPETLQPGMVITIEPGAYLPALGGVRIEDMVLVTNTGCQTLTPTPKSLLTL
ncbi:MAG: aminopeptidase P family protein [Acidobacteriales bacterium]|nr:aminopeptidase P family protein [Terriglobales bacterium]